MNDIIDRIAEGKAQLLSIEDICTRLGISRSTFDRWQKQNALYTKKSLFPVQAKEKNLFGQIPHFEDSGMTPFPPPDIRLGNSPKWEMQTFKKWLRENVNTSS